MKKIELVRAWASDNTIRYEVREDKGLGLLRQEKVDLFIRYHFNESFACDIGNLPMSVLMLPISLYLVPVTYFYNVEVIIPEMDKDLYESLPRLYAAYSKVYGPFNELWRGKITVRKIVENRKCQIPRYNKIVFFSGGVDACHAGINNTGRDSLLVTIPDIEAMAKNEGPLRDEKFALIKNFSRTVGSDWLLISNNFNASLYKDLSINEFLGKVRGLSGPAYKFDGWYGIKYIPNMCSVAPVAYAIGVKSLHMGSTCEEIDGVYAENLDGANPAISNAVSFAGVSFAVQEGLSTRRSAKVKEVISWCKDRDKRVKLWVCFSDRTAQCGFCGKCVRTQLNVLCAGENPREWGFDEFSERKFAKFIRGYRYRESSPSWLWDNIEAIDEDRVYPCLNGLLHWLKRIGYKEYARRAEKRAKPTMMRRMFSVRKYPHYVKVVLSKLLGC